MSHRTVLITGATGNQGSAVTDALLDKAMNVLALVRDPSSAKAQALAQRGVELINGDLNDGGSVEAAAKNVDSVFVLTTPFAPGVGMDGEIKQGRTVIDALVKAKVSHVVYSSVSDADRDTKIPHFNTKFDAERYLAQGGLPMTITAPVFFADNVLFPGNIEDIKAGRFRQAIPADRKLQVVSLRDIGRFNAAVIERGPELAGRRINYAGDELSPVQMTQVLSKSTGKALEFQEQPIEEVRSMMAEMATMYEWFDAVGYTADIPALRSEFPEVGWQTFADWANVQPWAQLLA